MKKLLVIPLAIAMVVLALRWMREEEPQTILSVENKSAPVTASPVVPPSFPVAKAEQKAPEEKKPEDKKPEEKKEVPPGMTFRPPGMSEEISKLVEDNRPDEALRILTEKAEREPNNPDVQKELGLLQDMVFQNREAAEKSFRRMYELNPKSAESASMLGGFLGASGKHADATRYLRQAADAPGATNQNNVQLGRNLLATGNNAEARQILEKSYRRSAEALKGGKGGFKERMELGEVAIDLAVAAVREGDSKLARELVPVVESSLGDAHRGTQFIHELISEAEREAR